MAYDYITKFNSPNYTPTSSVPSVYGMSKTYEGSTAHHWGDPNQNPTFENVVNYLCRQNGNTSAHYVVTGTGRRVACIVDPSNAAWHSGSTWGNAKTIGIELDPRARPEDYDVAAELLADIRSAYGDKPLYWHSYFIATACPGAWDMDRLDKLSYTKFSASEWGKGGNKNQPAPTPKPTPAPKPTPVPTPTPKPLYKLIISGKQVAAYSSDSNAYKGWKDYGSTGTINFDGKDVTKTILAKFAPSPTADPPEQGGGKSVTEKPDYSQENNALLKQLLSIVQSILNKLTSVFK